MLLPFLAAFQLAVTPSISQRVYNGRLNESSVAIPKLAADVAIDGRLDEPVWRSAALLTGFSLYSPVDGRPAPDSTDVYVWYSTDAIYFGIRAFEPHSTVTATLADRDRVSSDDNVEIHLDTFDERNRAFVFVVNPLGVQADGIKSEAGGFIPGSNVAPGQNDLSADFLWQSRGHMTEFGFEVEVRIPFSSLRYRAEDVQTWGLQIQRNVQHSGYQETWTTTKRASASFITQEGELVGLTGMHHGQSVELNPELTNTTNGTPCCASTLRDWRYSSSPQLGGNIRWALGSNAVLNGTIKPDFSQVEADATQIAADARFALFYAEKRPFFVEALDQFNVPNSLVYTRTIVQPSGAVKLTEKVGRADVAALSAIDQGAITPNGDKPLVDIVRLRQNFGKQSLIGMLYSDRVGGGRENRAFGADTKIVFGEKYFAQFQATGSTTSQDGVTRSGPMWEAVLDGTGRSFGFHYNVLGIHKNFQTDNGFVPRVDMVQPNISNRVTWYGKQGALLERFQVFGTLTGLWGYDDFFAAKSILEDHASTQMSVLLRGGWNISYTPRISSYGFRSQDYADLPGFVPSSRIETFTHAVTVSTPIYRRFDASVGTTVGNDVDFDETSRVERTDYNATLDLRPTDRLRVNATYVASAFDRRVTGVRSAETRIPRIKVEYQIARPIFVRVVSQYTAASREALIDPRTGQVLLESTSGVIAPSTASVSNVLRTDWLFSYRPTPGTVFFVGYGGSLSEADPLAFRELRRTNDSFFVKGSYLFRLTGF
ncbi:MAG TPA: carbohydrate binding family 9 domain-containing protein [Gemmatimonadaceae bacterium]